MQDIKEVILEDIECLKEVNIFDKNRIGDMGIAYLEKNREEQGLENAYVDKVKLRKDLDKLYSKTLKTANKVEPIIAKAYDDLKRKGCIFYIVTTECKDKNLKYKFVGKEEVVKSFTTNSYFSTDINTFLLCYIVGDMRVYLLKFTYGIITYSHITVFSKRGVMSFLFSNSENKDKSYSENLDNFLTCNISFLCRSKFAHSFLCRSWGDIILNNEKCKACLQYSNLECVLDLCKRMENKFLTSGIKSRLESEVITLILQRENDALEDESSYENIFVSEEENKICIRYKDTENYIE